MKELLQGYCALMIAYLVLQIILIVIIGFPQEVNIQACATGDVKGFWFGLWEGWIMIISFIVSLFNNDVTIYSINNNGGWYNFGFVLGAGHLLRIFSSVSQKK
jgi:hypothetical protein